MYNSSVVLVQWLLIDFEINISGPVVNRKIFVWYNCGTHTSNNANIKVIP